MSTGVYERIAETHAAHEARMKLRGTPEARRRNSEAQKKVQGTPEARKKMSEALKKYYENPDSNLKTSESLKKYYANNPDARQKTSEAVSKYISNHPEYKTKMSEILKKIKGNPTIRKQHSDAMKKHFESPEARLKNSNAIKKRFESPESRVAHSNVQKRRYMDRYWHGSVKYYDTPQYCEKFKVVKPKVRNFFEYKCVECDKPEIATEHHHHVHHVFYDKKSCCLEDVNGIYYSNLHVKRHQEKDYCIGENPNYFVLLCHSCHSKTTSGKFETRQKWADHFKELIDMKYGGVCYTNIQPTK